jgi:hypothetical protein
VAVVVLLWLQQQQRYKREECQVEGEAVTYLFNPSKDFRVSR